MLVFEKEGKPTIAPFAKNGKMDWSGRDISNFTNAITRGGQAFQRATGAYNPLTSDQNSIDQLMGEVYEQYGQVPEDFTGT